MIVWLWALAALAGDLEGTLAQRWTEARQAAWRSPTVAERQAVGEAVDALIRGAEACAEGAVASARRRLARVDATVEVLGEGPGAVWLVREVGERRGLGLYAIRCGPADPLFLQAPHSFFDVGTGRLARRLFVEGRARAVAWNTVHRYRATPDERPEDEVHPADVCHQGHSLFQAATVAAAAADPALRFVQLHGFAEGPAQVIVSSGEAARPPVRVGAALGAVGEVAVYGEAVWALGGTRNVQGRALAALGAGRFLHLELDRPRRDRLNQDADLRARLMEGLAGPWF